MATGNVGVLNDEIGPSRVAPHDEVSRGNGCLTSLEQHQSDGAMRQRHRYASHRELRSEVEGRAGALGHRLPGRGRRPSAGIDEEETAGALANDVGVLGGDRWASEADVAARSAADGDGLLREARNHCSLPV